jgi:NAD(P)-dependent dehydrogenase (short-subunit alcohol dehydrogenase family)
MSRLFGKVALVTGGGRGIGAGIVKALVRQGAAVIVADVFVDEDGRGVADLLADEIALAGGRAAASRADISTFAGCDDAVGQAVSTFGRIDILVTCAGNSINVPLTEVTEQQWESSLAVHVKGHVGCARAAARHMIEIGDGGRIITFASRGAFFKAGPAYAAAKAAIMGLTADLAQRLAPHAITANCMLPSAQTQLFPNARASTLGGVPPSTDMSPEHVAPLVAYLVSPQAGHLTGQYFYASGSDIARYATPLTLERSTVILRRPGGWDVDSIDVAMESREAGTL